MALVIRVRFKRASKFFMILTPMGSTCITACAW